MIGSGLLHFKALVQSKNWFVQRSVSASCSALSFGRKRSIDVIVSFLNLRHDDVSRSVLNRLGRVRLIHQTSLTQMMDVIIIGGGLAGLTCARQLGRSGRVCRLLESSDGIGGRVRTDQLEGFRLDRGFQVFLPGYPEARKVLDYSSLKFHAFDPGAMIRIDGKFHRLADPWRRPRHAWATVMSPAGSFLDKLRIARLRKDTIRCDLSELYDRPDKSTRELLQERGFSSAMIQHFFRPFLGGVFLDPHLETSSRMCEFVFRMFALGDAVLPEKGMAEIPRQIAAGIPEEVVQLHRTVDAVQEGEVTLSSGERMSARAIVVATEAPAARRLLGDPHPASGQSVTCIYFATEQPPIREPVLVLNGDMEGPINNLCVPSQVSTSYAPTGQSLVSVTVLGVHADADGLMEKVRSQLTAWFGDGVNGWRHLKTYPIHYALPVQAPPALQPIEKTARVRDGIFICGDHCDTASINGAIASGHRAAEAVLDFLG